MLPDRLCGWELILRKPSFPVWHQSTEVMRLPDPPPTNASCSWLGIAQ